jgi:hypothetical protein
MWGCALLNQYSREIREGALCAPIADATGVRPAWSGRPVFLAPVRIAGRKAVVSASTSTPGRFRHLTGDVWGDVTSTWELSPAGELRRESANLASPPALPAAIVSAMLADMDAIASAVADRAASDAAELAALEKKQRETRAALDAEMRKWWAETGSGYGGDPAVRKKLLEERKPISIADNDASHAVYDKKSRGMQDEAVVQAWAEWATARRAATTS